jgi:Tol biopolymer transport system component
MEAWDAKQFVSDSVARLISIQAGAEAPAGSHQNKGTAPNQNFFRLDLETGEQRQLTSFDLKSGSVVQNFDISPDGKRIVFDRLRNHADIVLMNLAR